MQMEYTVLAQKMISQGSSYSTKLRNVVTEELYDYETGSTIDMHIWDDYKQIIMMMLALIGPQLTAIINCSMRKCVVPDVWKLSRVTPIPKTFPAVICWK